MRLVAEFAAQGRHQPQFVGLCGGQHQRVQPQHGGLVVVSAALRGQHVADTGMQCRQPVLLGGMAAQALRQRQFQQIAAGVGRQPGLQIGVHLVHQRHPRAAMHVAPVLGRSDIAGHFGFRAVAQQQQIKRRTVFQPGEIHLESARLLQHGGAQHMEQRHQRLGAAKRCAQRRVQPGAPGSRQDIENTCGFAGQRQQPALRLAGRPVQAAPQPVEREFHHMALRQRLAGILALRHAFGQRGDALVPK
jgi:hypothetical protein